MDDKEYGYIGLSRKFFKHYLWQEDRVFSKAEAWLDLIEQARYKESTTKSIINESIVEWGYGEVPASIRFLKNRWGWGSNTKVERFLKILESDSMIKVKKGQAVNIISLCNYDKYDPKKIKQRTEKGRGKDGERTRKGQNSNKGNKGNKVNIPFSEFWDTYNKKKGDKPKAKEKWESLTDSEREYIMSKLPDYVDSFSDKQYQPYPTTFLNQRRWESEDEMNRKKQQLKIYA